MLSGELAVLLGVFDGSRVDTVECGSKRGRKRLDAPICPPYLSLAVGRCITSVVLQERLSDANMTALR
ncbi:hypothetical protein ACFFQF_20300 [Haladaptatus pallidirubidus]|uniref:hypothetical protein n=1 Tax=Haladaptatus pallidirubidus TaxID=1008152 RepID=UPI0035E547A5